MKFSGSFSPWPNQSWFWNWIQQAASTFSEVAGLNWSRSSSRFATSRGFGSIRCGIGSGSVTSVGALRPNRVPALPMSGSVGSWNEPS